MPLLHRTKKDFLAKKSVASILLFVFLILIVLSITASVCIHAAAQSVLKDEILSNGRNTIRFLSEKNMQSYEASSLLLQQWSLDKDIRQYNYNPRTDDLSERYWSIPIKQKIGEALAYHPYLANIYLYYTQSDVVLGNTSNLLDSQTLYEKTFQNTFSSCAEWKEYITKNNAKSNNSLLLQADDGKKYMAVWGKANYNSNVTSEVYIFLMIDLQSMLVEYKDQSLNETGSSGIYLLNHNNEVIIARDDSIPIQLPSGSLKESGGEYETEQYILLYSNTLVQDCRYAVIFPKTSFWEKMHAVRLLTSFSIGIYLLLAGVVVYIVLRWNKQQFKTILTTAEKSGVQFTPACNEFHSILEALTKTADDKQTLEQKLSQQTDIVRNSFLQKLLYGKINQNQVNLEQINGSCGLHLQDSVFAVLVYYIDNYQTKLYSPAVSMRENIQVLNFAIINVMEELLGEHFLPCSVEMGNTIVSIIDLKEKENWEQLLSVISDGMQKLDTLLSVCVTIAVSDIHNGIGTISYAYQEALQALEYRYFMKNSLIPYNEIKKKKANAVFRYSLLTEQQLANLIKTGKEAEAVDIMKGVLEENCEVCSGENADNMQYLTFDIINTLLKTADDLNSLHGAYGGTEKIKALAGKATCAELFDSIRAVIGEMCGFVRQHTKTKDVLVQNIKSYVQDNYCNAELSLTTLGDFFELSSSYLSRLFKEAEGTALLDYINKIRIGQSKSLLAQSKQSAQEISQNVGYNDYHSFSRTFKKLEGISPQQYRELHQNKG